VQRERAPNEPYDYGRFEIIEEPWPDPVKGDGGAG
jgi:hypothetical protein